MDSQVTTPMLRLFSTQELHIELSSKCTLKCPRCPRTELDPDSLNREFSIDEFKSAFPKNLLDNVNKIVFCGDIGDPIYATDFIDIISYVKNYSYAQVVIVTNGSYKKPEWWARLGKLLTPQDTVTFSIDGWDNDSNNLYRINSNWESIISGLKSLRTNSNCRIKWSSIYFSFNETRMSHIEQLAKDLGCDEWQAVSSTKFDGRYAIDGVDHLKPTNPAYIGAGVYTTHPVIFTQPKVVNLTQTVNQHEWARCLNWKKELFINVDGLVFPCPWFNSGYQQNDFVEKYKNRLNVKKRSLDEVLDDSMWEEFMTRIETMPLEVCRIKCRDCK